MTAIKKWWCRFTDVSLFRAYRYGVRVGEKLGRAHARKKITKVLSRKLKEEELVHPLSIHPVKMNHLKLADLSFLIF